MTTRIRTAYRFVALLSIAALLALAVRGELPMAGGGTGASTQPAPGFVPPQQKEPGDASSAEPGTAPATRPIPQITDEQVGASITRGVDFLLANFDQYQIKRTDSDESEVEHAGLNALCVYALLQAEQATRDPRLNLGDPFMKNVLDQLKHARLETVPDKPQPVVFARAMRAAALAVNNRPQDHSVLADDVAWLIRAHRQGAYTDDDNFGTPTQYTEPPPPPVAMGGSGFAVGQTTGVASGPRSAGVLPGSSRSPSQAAGGSRPSLAPSGVPDLSPSRRPNFVPSRIPNLDPSRLPNLNPSRLRFHVPLIDLCVPGSRGMFLNPTTAPSTQPWDPGAPNDPRRNRSRQDVIAVNQYGSHGAPGLMGQAAIDNVPFPWDAANSQFGLLGVSAGADVGIEVPTLYWQSVQYHWLKYEADDGTWSFDDKTWHSSIGPTWAGDWSLMITHDWLGVSQRADQLGSRPYHPGLVQALKWLMTGDNSVTIKDDQTNFVGYNLFMLELVGQASGFKFFGTHDWYRELAARVIPTQWPNGAFGRSPQEYDSIVQTAYVLLFLSSGRHPIFMEKLGFNGAWANRPRDVANLTRFASRELERKLNWEVVTLDRDWTDWLDSPVLFIASHDEPPFGQVDFNKLRSYAQSGGVLFTHADGGSKVFNYFVENTLAPALFPQYKMQDIPDTDPIYSVQYKINPATTKLRGVSNGSRWLLVHSPNDVAYSWQTRSEGDRRKNFELGVNLFVYAAGKTALHNRLASPVDPQIVDAPLKTARVVLLSYDGNWNPEPYAWKRLGKWLQSSLRLGVDVQTSVISALRPGGAGLAVLTGTSEYAPTDGDIDALKAFVSAGGWLLIDDCGGAGKFSASVEQQLLPKLTAEPLRLVPLGDPLLAGQMMNPHYREGTTDRPGGSYMLLYARLGKGKIIYSPVDYTSGLLGAQTFGILGYQPASAMALAENIVLQTSLSR